MQRNIQSSLFKITDITPSGLKPMSSYFGFGYFDTNITSLFYERAGVSFVWYLNIIIFMRYAFGSITPITSKEIRYYALVVNPGEFTDPAKMVI